MMLYKTGKCMFCGESGELEITQSDKQRIDMWRRGEVSLIQTALPEWPTEKREQLMTGTHPKCWSKAFGGKKR